MSSSTSPVNLASPAAAASAYRFEHPGIGDVMRDMYIGQNEPGPGDHVGPFELQFTDGRWLRSSELPAEQAPVLLIFGSASCPMMVSGVAGLKVLHEVFGARVRFVLVQVREAHPGAAIPQPQTLQQKQQHARALQRHYELPFEVAVDDIEGTLHQRLGGRPNSAYLLSPAGIILFRAQWVNQTAAIGAALAAIVADRMPAALTVTNSFRAVLQSVGFTTRVISSAGRGARLDFWKMALPVALLAAVADLLYFIPREKRGACAMALVAVAMSGLVATLQRMG
jgi:hypothetical protein